MSAPKPPARFTQSGETFAAIDELIYQHLAERDWVGKPQRGLVTSIALEAAELLEHYQWSDTPVGSQQDLADELADIFIYAFQFAQAENIDIPAAIRHKLARAAEKYPASAFKNKSKEENRQAWLDAKLHHHKDGL